MSGGSRRPVERAFAVIVLSILFLYLATDVSWSPDIWRFSYRRLAALVVYIAIAAGYLFSYRFRLPRWMEAVRSVTTVSLVTGLVALLVGEGVLRAIDPMPYHELPDLGRHAYDEDLGHVYAPNRTRLVQTREWRQEWRTNGQGVRADREYGPKPDDVVRILIVGDSFTAGGQVAVDSTYPGVLQRLLDERHGAGRFEVVNAGVLAYATANEAVYIAKYGAQFEPDVVLLGMTPNDLLENLNPLARIARDGAMVYRWNADRLPSFHDRQRWYNLRGKWDRSFVKRAISNATATVGPYVHRRAFQVDQDSASIAQYELAGRYLLEARDAAAGLGATFGFITIPFLSQFGALGEGLDPASFGERWSEFARSRGIPHTDVYPAFRAHPEPESLYWVEDAHCTGAGYELIGETLYDLLIREADALGIADALGAAPPADLRTMMP